MVPAIEALCGAGFTVAVCLAFGILLLGYLRLEFHRLESTLFAFVSGAACLSVAVFFLCVIHQAKLAVFLGVGGAAIALAIWKARNKPQSKPLPPAPSIWQAIFIVVFAIFFLCYFSNALAPEISPDGSSYHLGNVARDWRQHGFAWDYHSIYASMPQGLEMLFLVAFAIGRHPAAALVHMAFQTVLPLLIVCYGRRFGFPRAGIFAALLVYTCPVAGVTGISAYNDLAVATLIFAGFYIANLNHEDVSPKQLFLLGLTCGYAFTVKYTAGLALPFAAASTRRRHWSRLMLGAALVALPWMVRNLLWLHNPVAPFLNSWFHNPYWNSIGEHEYLSGLNRYPAFKSYSDFILQITVLGGLVPGMVGPAFILLPLGLLALRQPHGRRLLIAGAVFAIPAFLNTEVRFLIPALPFFALALGIAMENSWGMLPAVALFEALLCWPSVMTMYCDRNAWRVRGFEFRVALGMESQTDYIASHVGDYALKQAIERNVPPQSRIFSFAGRAAAYIDRDIVVGYESTDGQRIADSLEKAAHANSGQRAAAQAAKSMGVGFLLVNDTDGAASNMRNNLQIWRLTEVAKANATTLYRID